MRKRNGALALALMSAYGAASNGSVPADGATRLVVRPDSFGKVEIVAQKSLPPQFDVTLERDMPTPGWRFAVDGIDVLPDEGRIVARVSEIGPTGVTSQVITPIKLRLELGVVAPGTWLLEVRLRKGTSGPHRLAQAIVLLASGSAREGT